MSHHQNVNLTEYIDRLNSSYNHHSLRGKKKSVPYYQPEDKSMNSTGTRRLLEVGLPKLNTQRNGETAISVQTEDKEKISLPQVTK